MNEKRLLKLATFLDEEVPRKNFDYGNFASGPDLRECGTVACALGWATQIPAFKAKGLKLREYKIGRHKCGGYEVFCKTPGKRAVTDFDIGIQFFGLTLEESFFLFAPHKLGSRLPGDTATPKQVAKHIRKFVKNGGVY